MKLRSLLLSAALVAGFSSSSGQLVINEIMQSNIDLIMDDLNDFPDSWVELYNPSDQPADLSEYSIYDKDKPSKAYRLPKATIAPRAHYVVYCDKAATGRHASFRLESGKGCCLYLFRNGEKVDSVVDLKKQPAPNVSYGRVSSGASEWGYQIGASPEFPNASGVSATLLPDPVFSVEGRIGSEPFTLTITVPEGAPEGSVVRYTTDGSEPTASSRQMVNGIAVSQTTVVRAKLFCEGCLTARSVAQSYIFHPREQTLPIVSISGNPRYFYDRFIGILVEGNNPSDPNYGHDWRRPVNIEVFYPHAPGESVINQLIETRVKGGASRGVALKSMVLYANKRFGTKRLEYEFFPDDAPGITDWKSLEMRNSGNDFDYMYFRDAAIQRVMGRHADLDWQPWQPAIVYINGEYKGMLNIRTRSNEDYVYSLYDGEEDIDMFEGWWETKEGSWEAQKDFMAFYSQEGHTWEEFEQVMDCGEFCNLMLMNLYHVNLDFPGNNIVQWRPQAEGGRWRWIAKDTDFGLGLYGRDHRYPTMTWIFDNSYDPSNAWGNEEYATRLFSRLMAVERFKDMFIDRAGVYMGDFLNARGHIEAIDDMYSVIKNEYPYHRALFNPWWPDHAAEVEAAKQWVERRTPFFYEHLAEHFGLGAPCPLVIDEGRSDDVTLTLNSIPLTVRSFDGQWWKGRSLDVSAIGDDGATMSTGWSVEIDTPEGTRESFTDSHTLSLLIPDEATAVRVKSEMGVNSIIGVETPDRTTIDPDAEMDIFDLSGRMLGSHPSLPPASSFAPGVYLIRQNGKTFKLKW